MVMHTPDKQKGPKKAFNQTRYLLLEPIKKILIELQKQGVKFCTLSELYHHSLSTR